MSKSSNQNFPRTQSNGNLTSLSNGSRTPTSVLRTKLTPSKSTASLLKLTPKSTASIQKLTSVVTTPKSKTTPLVKDENTKPLSTPKCETPLSHHSKFAKPKGSAHLLNKRLDDVETPKRTRTPFSSNCKVNGLGLSRNVKSPATTPRSASNQRTPTKTTPLKAEKSFLVEFSDDILVTPRHLFPDCEVVPTLSVTSKSTFLIETPMSKRSSPFGSPLNRSLSTSSIARSLKSHGSSLGSQPLGCNGIKRSQSEAHLSNDSNSSILSNVKSEAKEGESSRVTVGVRVRPLHPREHGNAIFLSGREIRVASDLGSVHRFTYDHCFSSTGPEAISQEEVYNTLVKPLVDNAFDGYNACLFAYGQTGSGKTHSMMGSLQDESGITENTGIIPRFCRELISRVSSQEENGSGDVNTPAVTTTIEISYLEVYNEKIHDLLVAGPNQLKVREHPICGPYVADLSKKPITSFNEFHHWLDLGNKKRATAATEMNDKSSRSHSLFTVILTQTFVQVGSDGSWSHDQTRRSQINLVDLAGSERIAHSSVSNDRLREGVSINRSLLTLGKVMSALVEKRSFVPYRESVLTWLLKDSLGGNSRTTMLATVSPCSAHIEETLATLRYASQARSIVNTIRVNEAPQDKIIRELKAEVERLKEMQSDSERSQTHLAVPLIDEFEEVKADLIQTKEELKCTKILFDETTKKLSDCSDKVRIYGTENSVLNEKIRKLENEKISADLKLMEYLENNKQLASKVESEKADKTLLLNTRDKEVKDLLDDYNSLRQEFNFLKENYARVTVDLELVQTENQKLKSTNEEIYTLTDEIKNFELITDSLQQQLKESEKRVESEKSEKSKFINEKEASYKMLKKQVEDMHEIVKLKDEAYRQLEKQIKQLQTDITAKEESYDKLKKETNNLTKTLSDKDSFCDILKKEISAMQEAFSKRDETSASLNDEVKQFRELLDDKDKNYNKLKKEISSLNYELEQFREQSNEKDKTCEKFKSEIKSLKYDVKHLQELVDDREKLNNKLKNSISNLDNEVAKLQNMIKEKETNCNRLKIEISSLNNQVDHLQELMNDKDKMCIKLKKEIENLNEMIVHKDETYKNLKADMKNLLDVVKDKDNMCNNLKKEMKSLIEIGENKDEAYLNLKKTMTQLKSECDSIQNNLEISQIAAKEYCDKLKVEDILQRYNLLQEENINLKKAWLEDANHLIQEKTKIGEQKHRDEIIKLNTELGRLQSENSLIAAQKSDVQEELSTALQKLEAATSSNKHLESKLNEISISNKTIQEQLKCVDKEKKSLLDKVNKVTGEILVTDYKFRESIGRNQILISDKDEELKSLQIKYESLQQECAKLKKEISDFEHQLSISKMNEESLKGELNQKITHVETVQAQLKTAHQLQQELMEEKLTIIKVMEKQCLDQESVQNYKSTVAENVTLKRDLNINNQRLQKKSKKIEDLNNKVTKLEDIMKLILEQKISLENQKYLLSKALVKRDIDAHTFVMNLSFPHHLEYLARKARRFGELYRIPYDFEVNPDNTISIKHLLLSAKANLHHGQFNEWVEKVERAANWKKDFDADILWEVDFGDYYETADDAPRTADVEDPTEADRLSCLGTKKTSHGCLDPILWRRMLVKRHVQGIKEDSDVLMKYFPDSQDSRVYSILSRIQASVIRLEEITKNVFK